MAAKHAVSPVPRDRFAVGFFGILDEWTEDEDEAALDVAYRVGETLFPGDAHVARGFAIRFRALLLVLDRAELGRWVRHGPGERMHLHPALLDAASAVKVNKNGRFPLRLLTKHAETQEAATYADWDWP